MSEEPRRDFFGNDADRRDLMSQASRDGKPLIDTDDKQLIELEQIVREAANGSLPEANPKLRNLVECELEGAPFTNVLQATGGSKAGSWRARKHLAWLLTAAAGLLLAGGVLWRQHNALTPARLELADGSESKYQLQLEEVESKADRTALAKGLHKNSSGLVPAAETREKFERVKGLEELQSAAPTPTATSGLPILSKPVDNIPTNRLFAQEQTMDEAALPTSRSELESKFKSSVAGALAESSRQSVDSELDVFEIARSRSGNVMMPAPISEVAEAKDGFVRESRRRGLRSESLVIPDGLSLARHAFAESYATFQENRFVRVEGDDAITTFSIDVDTASYANMRRFIQAGQRPPRNAVRIEELVNYFSYDYPNPNGDTPFSVNMELADCPWKLGHKLLRVGIKGKDVHVDERPATNVVFLLDVSGSMNSHDKLPLLKRGFKMMVDQLNENDRVSIVTYAGNAGLALEPTSGDQKSIIKQSIDQLRSGGSTHGSAGIQLAYELAQENFIHNGVNKVILATDGDLNVGVTENGDLVRLIKEKAAEDVFLTVLGFGTGNLKDDKMEALADNGNGMYAYIDNLREAQKVLVEQMSGSLTTIAKDVKLQIEFNPAEVESYRLIGYENRLLAAQDFNDDQIDAGEIGAGHTVTAFYEIVTTDGGQRKAGADLNLKYQNAGKDTEVAKPTLALSKEAQSGELLTLALRYKQPDESKSKRLEFTIKNEGGEFMASSKDFRFAACVAAFGMLLRQSEFAGDVTTSQVLDWATNALGDDKGGYRAEFLELVRKSETL